MSNLDEISVLFQALSDPLRIRLLISVGTNSPTASDLVRTMDMSQPRVAHHLKILVGAGLLRATRKGRFVHYTCSTEGAPGFLVESLFTVLGDTSSMISRPVVTSQPENPIPGYHRGGADPTRMSRKAVPDPEPVAPDADEERPAGLEDYLL
jgi:DNA-binding transcriptional ArsR family regulator